MAKNPLRLDPTRTTMLRRRFMSEMNKRFRALKGQINKLLIDEDALGLASGSKIRHVVSNVGDHSYSVVMFEILGQDRSDIIGIQGMIDPNDLAEDGLEMEPHITVLYGLTASDPRGIKPLVESARPLDVTLGPLTAFSGGESDVLKIDVRGKAIHRLNSAIASHQPHVSSHPVYNPHVTVAYLKPGTAGKYVGKLSGLEGRQLRFSSLVFSNPDKERTYIQLLGRSPMVGNQRWEFLTTPQKLEEFKRWLQGTVAAIIFQQAQSDEDSWLRNYIEQGYSKGIERAFNDVRKQGRMLQKPDFYAGTREEFLRSSFRRPVSVERVKLLASRTFDDLKGITDQMSNQISRELVDGMVQGISPRDVARNINKKVDGVGRSRALTLARTETIRAHAEGALDAMEELGVEEIGVSVEWSTAEDELVCPLCRPLHGVVLKTKEAHGMFPRHPNCRCAPIPAGVGEDDSNQKRDRSSIRGAISQSIRAESRKGTLKERRARSRWTGADAKIDRKRPEPIV